MKYILTLFIFLDFLCSSQEEYKLGSNQSFVSNIKNDTMEIIDIDSILSNFDSSTSSPYSNFINLGSPYFELANSRLTLFRSQNEWALTFEKIGFDFRSGDPISFEIYYFGNCIKNLIEENGYISNYKVFGINNNIYECIENKIDTVVFNGWQLQIPLDKKIYGSMKIPLDFEQKIYEGSVLRYLVETNKELTYANDTLLYSSIPNNLKKILVIDEWYHQTYEQFDLEIKPSSQAFYLNIAKVLSTGDISKYIKPKKVNTHWRNFMDSGSY